MRFDLLHQWTRIATLAITIGIVGCSQTVRLVPGDIDRLVGREWVGTLTYRDYATSERTVIDSTLVVRKTAQARTWDVAVGYTREPHANESEKLTLSADGTMLGDERVIARETLPAGGVAFVTEASGLDDSRPAQFHYKHVISATDYSKQKLVKLAGTREWFERHVYRWRRGE